MSTKLVHNRGLIKVCSRASEVLKRRLELAGKLDHDVLVVAKAGSIGHDTDGFWGVS